MLIHYKLPLLISLCFIFAGCNFISGDALESSFTLTDSSFKSSDILASVISRDSLGYIDHIRLAVKLDKRAEKIKSTSGLSVTLNIGLVNDTVNYWGAPAEGNYPSCSNMYLNRKSDILYLEYRINERKIREYNCLYVTPFVEAPHYMGYIDSYFWNNTLEVLGKKGTPDDPTAFLKNEIIYTIEEDSVSQQKQFCFFIKAEETLNQVDSIDIKIHFTDEWHGTREYTHRLKYDWLEIDSYLPSNACDFCKITHVGRNGHDIATVKAALLCSEQFSIDSIFVSFDKGRRWYSRKILY